MNWIVPLINGNTGLFLKNGNEEQGGDFEAENYCW